MPVHLAGRPVRRVDALQSPVPAGGSRKRPSRRCRQAVDDSGQPGSRCHTEQADTGMDTTLATGIRSERFSGDPLLPWKTASSPSAGTARSTALSPAGKRPVDWEWLWTIRQDPPRCLTLPGRSGVIWRRNLIRFPGGSDAPFGDDLPGRHQHRDETNPVIVMESGQMRPVPDPAFAMTVLETCREIECDVPGLNRSPRAGIGSQRKASMLIRPTRTCACGNGCLIRFQASASRAMQETDAVLIFRISASPGN